MYQFMNETCTHTNTMWNWVFNRISGLMEYRILNFMKIAYDYIWVTYKKFLPKQNKNLWKRIQHNWKGNLISQETIFHAKTHTVTVSTHHIFLCHTKKNCFYLWHETFSFVLEDAKEKKKHCEMKMRFIKVNGG